MSDVALPVDVLKALLDGCDDNPHLHGLLLEYLRQPLSRITPANSDTYSGRVGQTAAGSWFIYIACFEADGETHHCVLPTRSAKTLQTATLREGAAARAVVFMDCPPVWGADFVPTVVDDKALHLTDTPPAAAGTDTGEDAPHTPHEANTDGEVGA